MALAVVELRQQVGLVDPLAVHVEHAAPQLHGVAGHPRHALDERDRGILRIPEDDHVTALDVVEPVDELVYDDALAVVEQRQHARALDPERLRDEGDEEEAEQHRHREVVDELPECPPDLGARLLAGRSDGEAGLAGDGFDARGFQVQVLSRRTTRVPAIRSWRAVPPKATMKNPIPRRTPDRA